MPDRILGSAKVGQLVHDVAPAAVGLTALGAGWLDVIQTGLAIAIGMGTLCLLAYRIRIARRTWRNGTHEREHGE